MKNKSSLVSSTGKPLLVLALALSAGTAFAQRPLGLDVSSFQGHPTWSSIHSSGRTFAWAKATEGVSITDADFTYNISNGKAAGVYMGAYDFAHPNSNTPGSEAAHFWAVAGAYTTADGKTLMPTLDFEVFSGVTGASSYSDWANQWCNTIAADAAANGVIVKPVLYTSACSACNFNSTVSSRLPWMANYNGQSAQTGTPWSVCGSCDLWGAGVWDVWQYSSTTAVPGVSGNCDVDVFNGSSAAMVAALVATPPAATLKASAGQRMKADFNGDGKEDVVVAYDYGSGNTALFTFISTGTSFSPPGTAWWTSGVGNWEAPRSQWVAGDFTGDGKADLACLYDYGNGSSTLFMFRSTGTGFASPVVWWSSGAGNWEAQRSKMVAGDFNHDGKADVMIAYDYGNGSTALFAFISTGTSFSPPGAAWWSSGLGNWEAPRSQWVAGDFTGDGKCDIAALYDYGNSASTLFVFPSTGTSLSSSVVWWSVGAGDWDATRSKPMAGDFNNDGKADIAIAYDYGSGGTTLFGFTSTGTSFVPPVSWWASGAGNWEAPRSQWVAGDFTGDGKCDISALYNYGNAASSLFVFRATTTGLAANVLWWSTGAGNWDWTRSTAF